MVERSGDGFCFGDSSISKFSKHGERYSGSKSFGLKLIFLFLLFSIFVVAFSNFVSADVISVNGGGDATGNVIVNPDSFIENFFNDVTYCGDGEIQDPNAYGVSEQCDDGNVVSGDGCSSTCQSEAVTPPDGGGGGGGGGGVSATNIVASPTEFNINLAVNTNVEQTVTVTNAGETQAAILVSQQGLDGHVILDTNNLTINAGQSQTFNVVFVATNETGIFTGKIIVGDKQILVSINVKTKLLLFDSNIVVLNKDFQVEQGGELKTLVTLLPMGDPERLDVTLNFVIKDFQNKVFLTKSETLLVEKRTELNRNFDTGILPTGDYVIGLSLVYPNGVAPSSAHFKVVSRSKSSLLGKIVIFLIILIILIIILIIVLMIIRRLRERRQRMQALSG